MESIQKRQGFAAVMAIAVGSFMASLDTSVVNVAMPVIQTSFHVTLSMVEWVITAYLLMVSSTLLMFGRLSDLYGHKKMYVTGFAVFTIGSLFCGLSLNIIMLIICRVLQALGAGMMFATGPAIITNAVSAENRGKALSISAIAIAVAVCTGPVIGGFLATLFGWASIFFINLPIGIFGIVFAMKQIPSDHKKDAVPFDVIGSVLIFIALILILLPLDFVGKSGLNSALFYGALGVGLLMAAGFIMFEKRSAYPMLDLALFKNRVFAAGNIAAVFNYMAQFIMVFLAPFYLEKLRMFTPMLTGMVFISMPLATLIIAPISGILSDRFDSRYLSSAGMGVMALGLFLLSGLKVDTSVGYMVVALVITGLGSGMFQTPNNSAVMGSIPPQNRGMASGTLATMRNIGMVMGVAVSGALFSLNLNKANGLYAAKGFHGLFLRQTAFTYALHFTFLVASTIAVLAMTASLVKGKVRT